MQPVKETVIIVHGTFSSKNEKGPPNWYAPDQEFCNHLDRGLENRNSKARCWAHLKPGEDFFHWDGRNDWRSRAKAATRLRKEIKRLKSEGWIVHLVGHSHGGNIIIDATTNEKGETQPWLNGRVTLFGTPIYSDSPSYFGRRNLRLLLWIVLSLIAWFALVLDSTDGVNLLAAFADGTSTQNFALFVGLLLFFTIIYLVPSIVVGILGTSTKILKLRWSPLFLAIFGFPERKTKYRWSPAFLAINTPFDEAYRSLAGLPGSTNPFLDPKKSRPSFFSNLVQVLESTGNSLAGKIRTTLNAGAILPAALIALFLFLTCLAWRPLVTSFLSSPLSESGLSMAFLLIVVFILLASCFYKKNFSYAVLLPGILLANTVPLVFNFVFSLLTVVFDSVIRNTTWGVVKSLSLGISGAPRKAEDITVKLEPGGDNLYLELPVKIVETVKKQQEPQLHKIQKLLYQADIKWSPGELREQLEGTNFPLIHTIYYRNADCIQKAADWIAEPVHEYWDGHHTFETITTVNEYGGIANQVQEQTEGPNDYKIHIHRLKLRVSSPGSIWRKPLSESEIILEAMKSGLPIELWDINKPVKPSRVPHPPPREE